MSSPPPWIIETSEADFVRDTIERSRVDLVVLDFWAPWCQPCRVLGPMMEKAALEAAGRFVLVRCNIDACPSAAASCGVEAIPAVFAIEHGRVVRSFVGQMDADLLRTWLLELAPPSA